MNEHFSEYEVGRENEGDCTREKIHHELKAICGQYIKQNLTMDSADL